MKKNLLFLFTAITLFFACESENTETQEQDINFSKTSISSSFNSFKNSTEFQILHKNFNQLISNLDLKTLREYEENGITYRVIKAIEKERYSGSVTFFNNNKNQYYIKVEIYNYNILNEIDSIDVKSKENELIYTLLVEKNKDNNDILVIDEKSIINDITLSARRNWFTCTRECAVDAFSICYSDPSADGCGELCTILLAHCWESIGTSCGVWCAIDTDNDLTPIP